MVKQGTTETFYYTYYLGNILALVNENGTIAEEYNFDAWGQRRNPQNWGYTNVSNPAILERGFTGHQHLDNFGLINMNARLYDPLLGRMLSPDNYVQSPDNIQSFNRYSYAWNNPLKYTDPDGNFIGTVFTAVVDLVSTAFIKGGLDPTSSNARNKAWAEFDPTMRGTKTNNAWRIDLGLFQTDPNRPWYERAGQLFLRFTWEAPQSAFGNLFSHGRNIIGQVDNVDYWGGATVVNKNKPSDPTNRWGLTLGPYINSQNMRANPEDPLFRHEYGHVLQSRIAGPTYLGGIGLPSLIGSGLEMLFGKNFHNHDNEWYESNANQLAFKYFSKHEPEALRISGNWNFNNYPIRYTPTLYWLFGNPILSPWTFIYGLTLQRP
jgi:RHS repeat-associated protein